MNIFKQKIAIYYKDWNWAFLLYQIVQLMIPSVAIIRMNGTKSNMFIELVDGSSIVFRRVDGVCGNRYDRILMDPTITREEYNVCVRGAALHGRECEVVLLNDAETRIEKIMGAGLFFAEKEKINGWN